MENTKRKVRRDEEIIFTNWTDKDFTCSYDQGQMDGENKRWIPRRRIYALKSGKSYYLPFYLAEVFAKHLADREYWNEFNTRLAEMKTKIGDTVDRRTLETRVQNSAGLHKYSMQEMFDKCVTFLPENEGDVEMAKPKEAPLREAVLRRDERAQGLMEKYGKGGVAEMGIKVNEKAIEQIENPEEEQFEEKIEE